MAIQSEPTKFFQGLGLIEGAVFNDGSKLFVLIDGVKFDLVAPQKKKQAFIMFLIEIVKKKKAGQIFKLLVYPRVIHFPKQDEPSIIKFQLVGFSQDEGIEKTTGLKVGEFRFSGLWQYIPVCPYPVLSIMCNRIEEKEKQMAIKTCHVPIDTTKLKMPSPKIYRFKKGVDGSPKFLSLTAKFVAEKENSRWVLEKFISKLSDPPRFVKFKKEFKKELKSA